MDFSWKVTEGQIRLGGGVSLVVDNPDAKIVEIDCNSKYPAFTFLTGGGAGAEVLLYADKNTLRWLTPVLRPTVIEFPDVPDDWNVLMESEARYTVRLVFYRRTS